WVPAFALFAAEGAAWGGELLGRLTGRQGIASALGAALAAGLAGSLVYTDAREKAPYVRGYAAAARYVVESTTEGPYCLFDGLLNGDFVLQVRTQDPKRSLWVLRGDKLFYSVLSDPHAGYTEFVRTKDELRAELHKYDPELIAVEEPQVRFKLRMATLLREVLQEDAQDFRLERAFEVESNLPMFRGVRILVYRKLVRNPARAQAVELELLGVRRKVSAPVGGRGGS
ncbi:MAG: hypothetical protein HY721_24735, partial [Planctomycetes bacterium]|nr:hypothetical protein [Planctomycetota bacterium]